MQHDPHTPDSHEDLAQTGGSQSLPAAAMARRRALLTGLGKGGAAIATAVPFRSFADTLSFTSTGVCTVSGAMSAVSSHTARHSTCVTIPPGQLANAAVWPAGLDFNTLTFAALFAGYSTDATLVKDILAGTAGGDTNRRYWVAANFNARLKGTNSVTFYYSLEQVLNYYSGTQSADFLAFLKKLWG